MGIDGNEIANQLARQGFSHPLTGSEPALGISANISRGKTRGWTNWKHEEHGSSYVDKGRLRAFLKSCPLGKMENCSVSTETS